MCVCGGGGLKIPLKFFKLNNKIQVEEMSYGFGVRVKVGGKSE